MLNNELALVKKLLVVRDITGLSAEYLIERLHQFENKQEQHLIYTLCSNLHRAAYLTEITLIEQGFHCQNRSYSHQSFNNLSYLDVDLIELIEKLIQQKANNQKALNGKGREIFRSL